MPNETPNQETTFGYLSVLELGRTWLFRRLSDCLGIGPAARVSLHGPVRPSRAQQILYGPTLEPYLLGEQIAGALLDEAKLKPQSDSDQLRSTLHCRSRIRCADGMLDR